MLRRVMKKIIRIINSQKYINFSISTKICDKYVKIPTIAGISCDLTEDWMINLLKYLLKSNEGAFFDIGVNLGQTLIKVKSIDQDIKYFGFEPNSTCVFYVNELIKRNEFKECSIFPIGIFKENKVLMLESINDTDVDASASIVENFRENSTVYRKVIVPVFCFNSIIDMLTFNKVCIVKIDVEGSELDVIESLYELIETHRPIILLEILPVYTEQNLRRKKRQEGIEKIFTDLCFVLFRIIKKENKFIGLRRINNIGIHSDINQCDYVVIHKDFVKKIQHIINN